MTGRKFTALITSVVLFSIFITPISFGQDIGQVNKTQASTLLKNTKTSKYLRDITQSAKDGHILPVSGIETEMAKVAGVLVSTKKKNPVLMGEFAGRQNLIVGNLALSLLDENAPSALKSRKVLELD